MPQKIEQPSSCECAYCSSKIEFALDEHLLNEMFSGNAVIFAGAGVSTENPNARPNTLYAAVLANIESEDFDLAFPDAVQELVSRPDGYFNFMNLVESHFDYISKFSDLRKASQNFFVELSTLPFLNEFVTTNWDRNFEDVCLAKPFVYDEDIRFWGVPRRKVLKIHGTIDNYSTIIASREDYDKAAESLQKSLIGAKLKELLSTKTCIFVGYSMQDEDLRDIFRFVSEAQGKFVKTHYFVNPYSVYEGPLDNIISLKTDGSYFLEVVKEHFASSPCGIPDEFFKLVSDELDDVLDSHMHTWDEVDPKKHPQALPAAMYQDGLIHGYKMILDRARSGKFSHTCEIEKLISSYEDLISDSRRSRNYLQAAYFTGYMSCMKCLFFAGHLDEFVPPPHYFDSKLGPLDWEEFSENFEKMPSLHKASYSQSKRILEKRTNEETVIQFQPWIV